MCDVAIAFDRAGYGDVITHQWGGRTCSDGMAGQVPEREPGDDGYVSVVDSWSDDGWPAYDSQWSTAEECELCPWCDEDTGGGEVCQVCGSYVTEDDVPLWKQRAIKLVTG